MDSSTQHRRNPEEGHAPRPVVWAEELWALVTEMRTEAQVLRRLRRDPDAAARDDDADRLVAALIRAEGDTWVDTVRAVQITHGAKPDTIRSWARRGTVRAQKSGGDWLYHRDDLLRSAQDVVARRASAAEVA